MIDLKAEYKRIMEETKCGWAVDVNICCPSDLDFIDNDFTGKEDCNTQSCYKCWNYVLENNEW